LWGKRENILFIIFFLSFSLLYKYFRKIVVQHKTNKKIKFVVRKQTGFFITFNVRWISFTRTFWRLLIEYAIKYYWRRCLWENSKDENWQRFFLGYQGDIGCPTGESSRTIVFHLVCQQNIGDFRLLPCAIDGRKLFLLVKGFQDCIKIQSDMNKLSEIHCSLTSLNVKL
jgi:hypothetical protein